MEKVVEQSQDRPPDERPPQNDSFAERRATLARLYQALPAYGSSAFWCLLEGDQEEGSVLPLEVLVKVLRQATALEDQAIQRRLFEIILARLQTSNEQWVKRAFAGTRLLSDERDELAADLCADLCETLLHALRDPAQRFWEEYFLHSLRFARKHVYERFMRREGRWSGAAGSGRRVPHTLLISLERAEARGGSPEPPAVFDESAEAALLAVELGDLATLVMRLPAHQRAVVWLIFWEGHQMKAVGQLLGISERTVRNRLHAALAELRRALDSGSEVSNDRDV